MHQLVTSTVRSSGVTATYLGTAPTGMTWSIAWSACHPVDVARSVPSDGGAGVERPRGRSRAVHRVVGHVDVRAVGVNAASTGAPGGARVAVDPEPRQVDRVGDGRVSRRPAGTPVSVWVYIMFWANTRPVGGGHDRLRRDVAGDPLTTHHRRRVGGGSRRRRGGRSGWRGGACAAAVTAGDPGRPRGTRRGVGRSGRRLGAAPPTTPRQTPPATRVAAAVPRAIRRRRTNVRSRRIFIMRAAPRGCVCR